MSLSCSVFHQLSTASILEYPPTVSNSSPPPPLDPPYDTPVAKVTAYKASPCDHANPAVAGRALFPSVCLPTAVIWGHLKMVKWTLAAQLLGPLRATAAR